MTGLPLTIWEHILCLLIQILMDSKAQKYFITSRRKTGQFIISWDYFYFLLFRCEFEEAHIGLITGRILPVTESPIYTTKAISFQDNNSCLSLNIVAAELQVAC